MSDIDRIGATHDFGCGCGHCQARRADDDERAGRMAALALAVALRGLGHRLGLVTDEQMATSLSVRLDRPDGRPLAWVFR